MSRKKKPPLTDHRTSQEKALERFSTLLPEKELSLMLAELDKPLFPGIRLNPLKTDASQLIKTLLSQYNWQVEPVSYCEHGYWIKEHSGSISHTIEHRLGYYYIQDPASMLPAALFDFDTNEKPLILDMAASPGGKTTHLISRTGDRGLVIANDASQSRITALKLVMQNWGGLNHAVTCMPGEMWGSAFPETFDSVLLDAPCSMQNLRSIETHQMRQITESERDRLAVRQLALLESALSAVKIDGQIVYATCTLNPEEDEGVLDQLMKKYPNCVQIDSIDHVLGKSAPGLTEFSGQAYHPDMVKTARLWPHRLHTSGFFTARLRKLNEIGTKFNAMQERDFTKTGLQHLSNALESMIVNAFEDHYGFDLNTIIKNSGSLLMSRPSPKGQKVFAIPEKWMNNFEHIPFQQLGLLVGEEKYGAFEPSHEWVTRFSGGFSRGKLIFSDDKRAAWMRGEDIRLQVSDDLMEITFIMVFDESGQFLGKGKAIRGRVRNLLPKRFV